MDCAHARACVHVCVCVYAHVCVRAHLYVYLHVEARCHILNFSLTFYIRPLIKPAACDLDETAWPASLRILSAGHRHTWLFTWVLEIQTVVTLVAWSQH